MGHVHHLQPMETFAPEYVRQRMLGFEKDAGICLTEVPHPFEGVVVQVDVGGLDIGRQRLDFHRETVILSRDLDTTR